MKGFADIGYIDDKTVVLEHRFPNEQPAQLRSMAAELVASGVDVLVVIGANAPPYAKEATKTIPVVFALMPDPIGSKLEIDITHGRLLVSAGTICVWDTLASTGNPREDKHVSTQPSCCSVDCYASSSNRFRTKRTRSREPVWPECESNYAITHGPGSCWPKRKHQGYA